MTTTTQPTTDIAASASARTWTSAAEDAASIRKALKARSWTSRQVSVKSDSFSGGSSIDITIKAPGVPLAVVKQIAEEFEKIDRCQITGEILSGGNRYVSVSLDWEMLRREGAKLIAWIEETPVHPSQSIIVEVAGEEYYLGRTHEAYGYRVSARNGSFIPTGQTAGAVAEFFAAQMIQAGIEVAPPVPV